MSTIPTEDEDSRPFRCEHPGCGATYRRKEHLTRHAVRHSQSKIFICETCGASFDRSDTLQRHKKVHNKEEQPAPPRVHKACNRCRAQKSRCDGKLPCSICQKRGAICSFDRDSPRSRKQQRQASSESYAETFSDANSREYKRRRLNPSVPLEQSSKDEQYLEESPVSDLSSHRTELPARSQPRSAKERLLQHEERLRRQGMRLAPADCSVPWHRPDDIFSSNCYSLDDPAGLDEDPTQPIDIPYYVGLYFAHFHPQWPFLHERSFRYEEDPVVLVLAVVMFGLWVTGEAKARRQAWKIHARLHTLLKEQTTSWHITQQEQPDTHKVPMATYQSILLHIIFALIAGPPPEGEGSPEILLDRIRPILTSLIETSLAQGLFFYPAILARGSPDDPIVFAWVRTEEAKRFSLTLFKVSILFSSITGDDNDDHDNHHNRRRRKLSVSDLRFPLPDNGFLWGSRPNIHEWWRRRDLRCKNPADTDDRWISEIFEDARARGGKAEERRAWLRMGAWLGFLVGTEP